MVCGYENSVYNYSAAPSFENQYELLENHLTNPLIIAPVKIKCQIRAQQNHQLRKRVCADYEI